MPTLYRIYVPDSTSGSSTSIGSTSSSSSAPAMAPGTLFQISTAAARPKLEVQMLFTAICMWLKSRPACLSLCHAQGFPRQHWELRLDSSLRCLLLPVYMPLRRHLLAMDTVIASS